MSVPEPGPGTLLQVFACLSAAVPAYLLRLRLFGVFSEALTQTDIRAAGGGQGVHQLVRVREGEEKPA